MFMEAQSYEIGSNIIFQDNKSVILLARNGRNSCTGNSRHVAVRYFFLKDRVDVREDKYLATLADCKLLKSTINIEYYCKMR